MTDRKGKALDGSERSHGFEGAGGTEATRKNQSAIGWQSLGISNTEQEALNLQYIGGRFPYEL